MPTTREDVLAAFDAHVYDLARELADLKDRLDRVQASLLVREKEVLALTKKNRFLRSRLEENLSVTERRISALVLENRALTRSLSLVGTAPKPVEGLSVRPPPEPLWRTYDTEEARLGAWPSEK